MDVPKHRGRDGNSEDVEETNNLTSHMLDWAKEKLAAGTAEVSKKEQAAPKTGRWEKGTVIIVAIRGDAPDKAKAHLFEDTADAERFVGTLVEDKVDQERVAVLRAKAVKMNVTYRPVIQLGVDGDLQGRDEQGQQP